MAVAAGAMEGAPVRDEPGEEAQQLFAEFLTKYAAPS